MKKIKKKALDMLASKAKSAYKAVKPGSTKPRVYPGGVSSPAKKLPKVKPGMRPNIEPLAPGLSRMNDSAKRAFARQNLK